MPDSILGWTMGLGSLVSCLGGLWMSEYRVRMKVDDLEIRKGGMMAMVCGAETTPEEDFLYCQEMMEFFDKWEDKLTLPPDRYGQWQRRGARSFLEDFAWALKRKIDEEGL